MNGTDSCEATGETFHSAAERLKGSAHPLTVGMFATVVKMLGDQIISVMHRVKRLESGVQSDVAGVVAECLRAQRRELRLLAWTGPYDAGRVYKAGDLVQQHRKLFVAVTDHPEGLPTTSAHWRLLME